MDWLSNLLKFWARLANTMAVWATNAQDWLWPLNKIAPLVVKASEAVDGIFGAFFDFKPWIENLADQVSSFLSWDAIRQRLSIFLSRVNTLWAWFSDRTNYLLSVVNSWWQEKRDQVLLWIETLRSAVTYITAQWSNFRNITFPHWVASVNSLRAKWDDFVRSTLPSLISSTTLAAWWQSRLLDVQGLITSAFTLRQDLWQGWQDWRDKVIELFTDPEDYIIKVLEKALERFW